MPADKSVLKAFFYERPVLTVARELIGKRLVRMVDGQRISGLIVEAEAYDGETDLACHARAGRTPRTETMYGPPGRAYVYFTYGMHWMLNCVCAHQGYPAAVLIRAILPLEGTAFISSRRPGRPAKDWCNGPAKLCQALEITGSLNGADLCLPDAELRIEEGLEVPDARVQRTPRIGIDLVPEPWRSQPWRFVVASPEKVFAKA
ncbi:MAG: DNA-3-methyladenine glycosylase [Anaerolineae bacterium]|nr:DNA-3-methyladenine glycosylase [Anaerolineae bacterium]